MESGNEKMKANIEISEETQCLTNQDADEKEEKFTKHIVNSQTFTVDISDSGEFTINIQDCQNFTVNISDCKSYSINQQDSLTEERKR